MSSIEPVQLPPKIFNVKGWIKLTEAGELQSTFDKVLAESGFKMLNYSDHQFPLNGFTALWLLAESHLALHTFNDSGWTYIELSSCNENKALIFLTLCDRIKHQIRWENKIEELSCQTVKTPIG